MLDIRSTGKICKLIGDLAETILGAEVFFVWKNSFSSKNEKNEFVVEKNKKKNIFYRVYYHFIGKYIDYGIRGDGFVGIKKTKRIIKYLKKIKPDIIHLHNIHGGYCNLKLLFNYIKTNNIPIVFTAHDCWMITGCCPHFLESGCTQYKTDYCKKCNYIKKYPLQYRNIAKKNLLNKIKYVGGCNSIVVVTCSNYLELLFRESYLLDKRILTIHNGIDTDIFNYTNSFDGIFEKYGINHQDSFVLAVADFWSSRKGDSFISRLSLDLERRGIPLIIIGKSFNLEIGKTTYIINSVDSQKDMACFYSKALLLVNPTLEDNYPTVLLEACCCGTPAVSFDTGGCGEIIKNGLTGFLVERLNYDLLLEKSLYIANSPWDKKAVRDIAVGFADQKKCYLDYLDLYKQLVTDNK